MTKMRRISVDEAYVELLCQKMLEWVKLPDSYIIPQFLQYHGIGYPYLKYLINFHPEVCNTFDVMNAILTNRWFFFGINSDELAPHKVKMLMKYLSLYDSHATDMHEESKIRIADADRNSQIKYIIDKYNRSKIKQPYKEIYDKNDKKRKKKR